MKKSVNLYFNQKFDSATKLQTIKAVGYDEFYTGVYDRQETLSWPEQLKMARDLGLGLTMVHCQYYEPDLNGFWLPGAAGERVMQNYLQQIQACGPAGVKNFVIHLNGGFDSQTTSLGLARLQMLLKACEPYQMNLCVENLYSATEIPYLFSHLQHPLLKICYDSGHRNWLTPDFELVRDYHQYITVLHLHDNDGTADQHRILVPDSPVFQRLQKEIKLLNPDVTLAAEIKIPDGTCREILQQNFDALSALEHI